MANHKLSLECPDTMNLCQLRLIDTSLYSTLIPVTCPLLQITLPGFTTPVNFTDTTVPFINPGFILNLTACDLQIQTANCGTSYSNLPDGIYIIKYSVSPNDTIYVEYNHLRETKALTRYQSILCDLELSTCDPPELVKNKIQQLQMIKMYLDAAKAKVEFCHNPIEGMELYKYAVKLLNKIECKTCK